MKLNLGAGPHPLDGFENLDISYDVPWRFEDGLADYADGTVEAITESHALMYVPLAEWAFIFAEFARVLRPNGIVRLTQDNTADPASPRYGIRKAAKVCTNPLLLSVYLHEAGFEVLPQHPQVTCHSDDSLIQQWYGAPPLVFHIEGRRKP